MRLIGICLVLWPLLATQAAAQQVVELPGEAADLAVDFERGFVYVSVPDEDAILRISTNTYQIVDSLFAGQAPRGLELSEDNQVLFAALSTSGSVGILDLETDALQTVDLFQALDHSRAYDVSQARSDKLFVSASPGSSGFAHIVSVDLVAGHPHRRVASGRIIRCDPTFEKTRDQSSLYVGECFSPNSLYKLDIVDADAPIVLEDDHGSVSGTRYLEVGDDLSRIFLGSGQVLDTSDFSPIGETQVGIPRFGTEPDRVYILALDGQTVSVYDSNTLAFIQEIDLQCPPQSVVEFFVLPNFGGFLVLGNDKLCAAADDPIFLMQTLSLQRAHVAFRSEGRDSLALVWEFDLDPASDGLDPASELVRVSFGTLSESIPAGSFSCSGGVCEYRKPGSGITHARISDGFASFLVQGVDLSGTSNPAEGSLEIGNDFGSATTRLRGVLRGGADRSLRGEEQVFPH